MEQAVVRQVGFIGLGIMGSAMAANLLKAGFRLTVWNRTPAKTRPLVERGAAVAGSPADLAASGVEVICLCVSDTPDVEEVLFGPQGIAQGARPGLIVVDHSTIDPIATQRFAQRLAERGVVFMDAPVSGGDVGARNATLSIMVGGPREAFERVQPVLAAMGKAIRHLGPVGMGQVCKAANQIAVACNLMGVCEAVAFCRRMGLDPRTMMEVVGAGAGASWQLANLGPKILEGNFQPGFMVDLMLKDLRIVLEAAQQKGLRFLGTAAARQYLEEVRQQGAGREGTQAMIKAVDR